MKKIAIMFSLLLALLPASILAAELRAGESYTSGADQTITEDLYIGAGTVSMGAVVEGDLVTAGGRVVVSGDVSEDLIVAGGDVIILGNVEDDIRAVGGNITVSGSVGGDLVMAGGNVHVVAGSQIAGDVIAAAGVLIIDGEVQGNVKAGTGSLIVNGTVNGSITSETEELKFGSSAVVDGDVNYKAINEADIAEGAQLNSAVNFEQRASKSINKEGGKAIMGLIGLGWLTKLIMQLVASLILLWLAPKLINSVVRQVANGFGKELARGFVVLVVTPFAMLILAISIVGLMLALPLGFAYATVLMLGKTISAITFGYLLFKWFKIEHSAINWKIATVGVITLNIVAIIPIIGWIISCVIMLATLGSLSYYLYQHLLNLR